MDRRRPGRRGPSHTGALPLTEAVVQTRATKIAYFVAGAICAPLSISALFQAMPFDWPLAAPFVPPLAAAGVLFWRPTSRSLALGLIVGTIAWGLFLTWLFYEWSTGMRGL